MLETLLQNTMWLPAAIMTAMSVYSLFLMCLDKYRAVRKKRGTRRIPERRLLWCAVLFGAIGILAGMLLLRHKVNRKRHPAFAFGVPPLAVIQTAIVLISLFSSMGGAV